VLVDESPPEDELDRVEAAIAAERAVAPEIAGYHKLRGRRVGVGSYVDFHLQFHRGTTLEDAHAVAHRVRSAIQSDNPRCEVLIHVEPEDSVRPPEEAGSGPYRAG
jgi:divalent metal cation (Fe/Co/Zn/Cd) transporter